ncbi:2'-5' RNA ligase family protein [Phormidesmis sp. 146-33]
MALMQRFFIALLPPQDIQDRVTEIKQYFTEHYATRHAHKSPPHITLQPPFEWSSGEVSQLEQSLKSFAQKARKVPIVLDNFAAFPPRVIYINVLKTPDLLTLQQQLMAHLEATLSIVDPVSKSRPFVPHMTVAFRDLTRQNFAVAWEAFHNKSLHYEFVGDRLTLLVHTGDRWTVASEFPFLA